MYVNLIMENVTGIRVINALSGVNDYERFSNINEIRMNF